MAHTVRKGRLHIGSCPLFLKNNEDRDVFHVTGRFEAQRSLESLSWKRHSQVRNLRHRDGKWVAPGHIASECWDQNLLENKI